MATITDRGLPPPLQPALFGGERARLLRTQLYADGVSVEEGAVGTLMNASSQAASWAVVFSGAGGGTPRVVPACLLERVGLPPVGAPDAAPDGSLAGARALARHETPAGVPAAATPPPPPRSLMAANVAVVLALALIGGGLLLLDARHPVAGDPGAPSGTVAPTPPALPPRAFAAASAAVATPATTGAREDDASLLTELGLDAPVSDGHRAGAKRSAP
jgi:hypothetical protein